MKGYKLTRRGKITALCLVLIAVMLLASAFKLFANPSPAPTPATSLFPTPTLSHANPSGLTQTPAPTPSQPPQSSSTQTPQPEPTPTAKPTGKPTTKPTVAPSASPLPAGKTSLYFTPGTLDFLASSPDLHDYLLDSYEGFTLVVEGFASETEEVSSAEQLALDRSKTVSQLFKELGVNSYDLLSIATTRKAQDEKEMTDFARVDVYFLPTGSK